ncbi:hypothetical protein P7C70_g506, partial [Phenoliferia sp. Uapishka_3]
MPSHPPDPVREQLQNPAALSLLLSLVDARDSSTTSTKLTRPVYVVNSWVGASEGEDEEEWKEKIQASSTIAGWAMNMLEDLLSADKNAFPPSGIVSLSSIIISSQSSPSPPSSSSLWTPDATASLLDTDLALLTVSASLLEALSIDLESAKQSLAFSPYSTDSTLLAQLLSFIESATPPKHWERLLEDEDKKVFGTVKTAVVRAVVEAPNSDEVMDKLFNKSEGEGKNWIVEKLVGWVGETKEGREDLLICAAHMLAALGRKDEHCVILVQEYGLAGPLSRLVVEKVQQQLSKASVRPGEVTQILFGVVSLLRHLSIPVPNKAILGETGVIETVSLLLRPELDMVTPLQNAVVGLLKHLTASNRSSFDPSTRPRIREFITLFPRTVTNSLHFIGTLPPPTFITLLSPPAPTPLSALLALIPRTNDVRLRSEASRTLVNVVRSFFSAGKPYLGGEAISPVVQQNEKGGQDGEEEMKKRAREEIVKKEVVDALSEMGAEGSEVRVFLSPLSEALNSNLFL